MLYEILSFISNDAIAKTGAMSHYNWKNKFIYSYAVYKAVKLLSSKEN